MMRKRTGRKHKPALHVNHTHKDSIFSLLFGTPDNLRTLYNAVTNAHYDKNTRITINTLTDALYMNRVNDISFTIGEEMVILLEHQSTMGLREAVNKAVKDCVDEDILKDFLQSISSEAYIMLFTEWDQEKALEVRYREGVEKGIKQEQKEIIDLLKNGKSPEEIIKLYDKKGQ
jgi:hypothetical protein